MRERGWGERQAKREGQPETTRERQMQHEELRKSPQCEGVRRGEREAKRERQRDNEREREMQHE